MRIKGSLKRILGVVTFTGELMLAFAVFIILMCVMGIRELLGKQVSR